MNVTLVMIRQYAHGLQAPSNRIDDVYVKAHLCVAQVRVAHIHTPAPSSLNTSNEDNLIDYMDSQCNTTTRQSEMTNTSPRHMPMLGNVHPIKI